MEIYNEQGIPGMEGGKAFWRAGILSVLITYHQEGTGYVLPAVAHVYMKCLVPDRVYKEHNI